MLVLFWVLASAGRKKKTPPRGGQPWDQAKRRQSMPPIVEAEREVVPPIVEVEREVPRPSRPFPNLQDLGKEIREVLLDVDGDLFSEPTVAERKKAYRIKNVAEVKTPISGTLETPDIRVVEGTILPANEKNPIYHPKLFLGSQAVVRGIIMSEILQPPRAKRPFRH